MESTSKTTRKRGRPRAGRKGFHIRMSPHAHKGLVKLAKKKEMSLGVWLERLASVRTDQFTDDHGRYDKVKLDRRFKEIVWEIAGLTQLLEEILSLESSLAGEKKIKHVLLEISQALRSAVHGA